MTGDKWQSLELDRAGLALYQPSYTNSYLNRNWYCSQTELVGYPVVNVKTYSDQQCKWIGENVIAPIWQAFASVGVNVNLDNVRYHADVSGSASEYWHGRLSDDEWWNFNGILCHIDAVGNDHWDCSVEDTLAMASYARAYLGQGPGPGPQPPTSGPSLLELGMFLLQSDHRGVWLMGPGYARGLNAEEYNTALTIPGIKQMDCGGNQRAWDLTYSMCMHGATADDIPGFSPQ
jgi:hypothetical protein